MSGLIKRANSRTIVPRDDKKENTFDNSVKTYQLSDEELEKYRNGEKGGSTMNKKNVTQKQYEDVRLKVANDADAAKELGISVATLYNKKKQWGLAGKQQKEQPAPVKKEKVEVKAELAELLSNMTNSASDKTEVASAVELETETPSMPETVTNATEMKEEPPIVQAAKALRQAGNTFMKSFQPNPPTKAINPLETVQKEYQELQEQIHALKKENVGLKKGNKKLQSQRDQWKKKFETAEESDSAMKWKELYLKADAERQSFYKQLEEVKASINQSARATEYNRNLYEEVEQLRGQNKSLQHLLTISNNDYQELNEQHKALAHALKVHI